MHTALIGGGDAGGAPGEAAGGGDAGDWMSGGKGGRGGHKLGTRGGTGGGVGGGRGTNGLEMISAWMARSWPIICWYSKKFIGLNGGKGDGGVEGEGETSGACGGYGG